MAAVICTRKFMLTKRAMDVQDAVNLGCGLVHMWLRWRRWWRLLSLLCVFSMAFDRRLAKCKDYMQAMGENPGLWRAADMNGENAVCNAHGCFFCL